MYSRDNYLLWTAKWQSFHSTRTNAAGDVNQQYLFERFPARRRRDQIDLSRNQVCRIFALIWILVLVLWRGWVALYNQEYTATLLCAITNATTTVNLKQWTPISLSEPTTTTTSELSLNQQMVDAPLIRCTASKINFHLLVALDVYYASPIHSYTHIPAVQPSTRRVHKYG